MSSLKKIVFGLAIAFIILIAAISIYFIKIPSKKPIIGIIEIEGYLLYSGDREVYLKAIDLALKNDTIKAVVVRINSGGGLATICEEVYSGLKKLSEKKPVVASIEGIAASGGYYIALGARYIYATPSSLVGNVGVIAYTPPIVLPTEQILETGAYKLAGFSVREFPLVLDTIFQTFIDSVREGRGDRLKISIEEVATGKLFLAVQAVEAGLIDELGSYLDAVNKAADLANIEDYKVVNLTKKVRIEITIGTTGYKIWKIHGRIPLSIMANLSQMGYWIYYVPPYMVEGKTGFYDILPFEKENVYDKLMSENGEEINASGKVVIDLSHQNVFPAPIMIEFMGKIVEKGGYVFFLKSNNLKNVLEQKPLALIIFTPLQSYSSEEIFLVKKYVKSGGKLILAYDPAIDLPIYMNDLSQEFGFIFSTGYLYSSKDKYGVYRNVVVRNFANSTLTMNVSEIIVFTGASIYTNATKIAITSNTTRIAITDIAAEYAVIAQNDTVLALGDTTFMLDPFLQLADNEKLVNNIVNWILEKRENP